MSTFDGLLDPESVDNEADYVVASAAMRSIRRAITFGLCSAVEAQKVNLAREGAKAMGEAWPDEAKTVTHAQSFEETIEELAQALLWLEYASHVKGVRDGAAAAE